MTIAHKKMAAGSIGARLNYLSALVAYDPAPLDSPEWVHPGTDHLRRCDWCAQHDQPLADLLLNDPDIYRSFPLKYITITADGVIPKDEANQAALVSRDEGLDTNRFSGQSLSAGVPAVLPS